MAEKEECPYCGTDFKNLPLHVSLVHKGEDPEVKQDSDPRQVLPGTVVGDGIGKHKVPWTRWHMEDPESPVHYPMVEFIPERTVSINPHGVHYRVVEGVTNRVPSIVQDIYNDMLREDRAHVFRHTSRPEEGEVFAAGVGFLPSVEEE